MVLCPFFKSSHLFRITGFSDEFLRNFGIRSICALGENVGNVFNLIVVPANFKYWRESCLWNDFCNNYGSLHENSEMSLDGEFRSHFHEGNKLGGGRQLETNKNKRGRE